MAYIGFDRLAGKLAPKYGPQRAKAIAASIGRKKYGAEKFDAYAAKGKKMVKAKPKRRVRRK